MEPQKIDWKGLEWEFVEDEVYEHINAPKWVDLTSPLDPLDDSDAWFCRPECKHPKTAEDFLKLTPPSKLSSSAHLPLSNRPRDFKLKRRGLCNPNPNEDGENQDPNFSTPQNHQLKSINTTTISSTEKKNKNPHPVGETQLKSMLSARNLFPGREILNHITEFCNELKRMATMRARERKEEAENEEKKLNVEHDVVKAYKENEEEKENCEVLAERKPLIELRKEKSQGTMSNSVSAKMKQKTIKKRFEENENIAPMPLDLENIKVEKKSLIQIRTNPPSPQCFSATRVLYKTTTTTTPSSKGSSSKSKTMMEKGMVLQEMGQSSNNNKEVGKEISVSVDDGKGEARSLDVFWFLKPCTLSTT